MDTGRLLLATLDFTSLCKVIGLLPSTMGAVSAAVRVSAQFSQYRVPRFFRWQCKHIHSSVAAVSPLSGEGPVGAEDARPPTYAPSGPCPCVTALFGLLCPKEETVAGFAIDLLTCVPSLFCNRRLPVLLTLPPVMDLPLSL